MRFRLASPSVSSLRWQWPAHTMLWRWAEPKQCCRRAHLLCQVPQQLQVVGLQAALQRQVLQHLVHLQVVLQVSAPGRGWQRLKQRRAASDMLSRQKCQRP